MSVHTFLVGIFTSCTPIVFRIIPVGIEPIVDYNFVYEVGFIKLQFQPDWFVITISACSRKCREIFVNCIFCFEAATAGGPRFTLCNFSGRYFSYLSVSNWRKVGYQCNCIYPEYAVTFMLKNCYLIKPILGLLTSKFQNGVENLKLDLPLLTFITTTSPTNIFPELLLSFTVSPSVLQSSV